MIGARALASNVPMIPGLASKHSDRILRVCSQRVGMVALQTKSPRHAHDDSEKRGSAFRVAAAVQLHSCALRNLANIESSNVKSSRPVRVAAHDSPAAPVASGTHLAHGTGPAGFSVWRTGAAAGFYGGNVRAPRAQLAYPVHRRAHPSWSGLGGAGIHDSSRQISSASGPPGDSLGGGDAARPGAAARLGLPAAALSSESS
jgi:hypothetical protein